MAYTAIDDPSAHFQITLYTGDQSTHSITNTGNSDLQPDFIWIKERSSTSSHAWFDSTRGVNAVLVSSTTAAEDTSNTELMTAFNSDGFTVDDNNQTNQDTITHVAWQWKANAGSTTTNDASATGVGSIDSVYQANTTAGFSIVTYTGTGSTATVAHGLGGVPDVLLFKKRSTTDNWYMYHSANTAAPETDYMTFDTTAATTDFNIWNDTAPTSTVFSISNAGVHADTTTMVCYAWREIQGYSKFGGYTGNGNADGVFNYCGFKPAFVITKRSETGNDNWHILDHKRDIDNPAVEVLQNNEPDAEGTTTTSMIDFLSNGFKCRGTGSSINTSDKDYIYIAFAESPFVTSGGVPCTAR